VIVYAIRRTFARRMSVHEHVWFVIATTFYFHDFWNQPAPDNARTLVDALKNLSIIGALFIIAGYGRGPRNLEPAYGDV